jgi:hypothetical protein
MNATVKSWLIGVANALVSGAASGVAGLTLGIGVEKSLIILAASAGVSLSKWILQHPIPGGLQ